jgi:HEAT repeat protein
MVRRILVLGVALLAVTLFSMGPAKADRLGGAYRGPYTDETSPKDETEQDIGGADTSSVPDTSGTTTGGGSGGEEGTAGGEEGGGEEGGGETPPPGEGGGEEAGTPDEGSGNENAAEGAPDAPGATPGASPGIGTVGTGPGGGKKAVDDVKAFWMFWFEHNKEWILEQRLRQLAAKVAIPQDSSPAIWAGSEESKNITPLTEEDKRLKIFPLLVDKLQDKSNFVRDAAVLALGKLGIPEAVPEIAKRVHDKDRDVGEDALLALGLTRQKEALKPLIKAVRGPDLKKKAYAALGLGLLGMAEAHPTLVKEYQSLVKRGKQQTAACVAVALGMIGNEETVAVLAGPLRKGQENLNVYICQALGRIGGKKAMEWLLRAAQKADRQVQGAAILALSNFPEKTVVRYLSTKGVKSGDRMVKVFSVVSLSRIARSLPENDAIRKKLLIELKDFTEDVNKDKYMAQYGALGQGILDQDVSAKWMTDQLGGKRTTMSIQNKSALAMATGLLDMRNVVSDLRGYAAFSLGILGDSKSKEEITERMKKDRRKDLLRSGCWALGLLGDKTDVPWLLEVLTMEGGNKHQVRGAAAIGIGLIGDQSAVDPLLKMVREEKDNATRAFAIAALGCLIDKDPVPRIPQIFANIHYRARLPVVKEVFSNL